MNIEHNINDLEEIRQMREQIATLRSKLESQQIVSEKVIVMSISKGVSNINHRGIVFSIFGFLAIPFCSGCFHFMGCSDGFVLGTAVMLAFCLLATVYVHLGLREVDVARGNMLEVSKRVLRLRKQYVYWHLWSVPMLVVWGYFLYQEICIMYPDPYLRACFLLGAVIGGTIGGAIGLWQHFKVLRMADEVLSHINELQES